MSKENLKLKEKDFDNLSPEGKRVAIALDAKIQILMDKYQPNTGHYVILKKDHYYLKHEFDWDTIKHQEARDVMKEDGITCSVCAKGALLCSLISYKDNASVNSIYNTSYGETRDRLKDYFSVAQIDLIELAFEGFMPNTNYEISTKTFKAARKFYETLSPSKERLLKILDNIVDNNGTFIP